jgi:PAS domain S-box-containing protein
VFYFKVLLRIGRAGPLLQETGRGPAFFRTFRNLREINPMTHRLTHWKDLAFKKICEFTFLAPVMQRESCACGSEIAIIVMFPAGGPKNKSTTARKQFMSKPLRVLIVEDSEDDTLFLIRELKRGGFDPDFQRVDNLTALSAALDQGRWDIVISDHTLPGFGSLHALDLVRQRGLDVPFIVVSGTIGEDAAVKAMKAGANDYVMKSKLSRLQPAVERELGEARSRQIRREAEAALLRSEQELNDFFEHAPLGLHWMSPEGTILRVNQVELEMFGYSQEEYVGRPLSDFCPDRNDVDDLLGRLNQGESLKGYETRMRCKDGSFRHVQIDANVLREKGKFVHSRCFVSDITDRKRGEEASAYLAAIVNSSDDAIVGTTLDGVIQSWNAGAEKMYGYDAKEVVGRPLSLLVPPYRPEEPPSLYARIKNGEWIGNYETVRLRKDGSRMPVSLTFSPIMDQNESVVGISAIERDMTDRKAGEEERLKLIAELTEALGSIKTLRGLIPICSWCKKIRDDHGYWEQVESYVSQHTEAEFTHSICPDCQTRVKPELACQP